MKNFNLLLNNHRVIQRINDIMNNEKDRVFCKHDMYHFLSVARIAYILCLEQNVKQSKDLIYCTSLLHDLGRYEQIHEGKDHAITSYSFAQILLEDTDFNNDEKNTILDAILHHRKGDGVTDFSNIFYKADKLSRECRFCEAKKICNWSEEEKNTVIKY